MRKKQNKPTTSNSGQTTRDVSRRKLLQITGISMTGAILGTASVSADDGQRSRNVVFGGSSESSEDDDESSESSESGAGGDAPAIGGGEGYEEIVTQDAADTVVSTQDELSTALSGASSGDVVFIESSAEINMDNTSLTVPAGVTVASDRGEDGSAGALLQTSRGNEPGQLFQMNADSRITGIRMRGPWPDGPNGSTMSDAVSVVATGVEIDNCLIEQFSYAGVNLNNGEAHVHHNVIRENNRGGLGYGVTMSSGQPLIEYNYFNYNRHSIASTGSHTGYVCRYNHFGPDATGIVIDIHSPAGEHSEVHNNIVEAVDHIGGSNEPLPGLQVRGVPGNSYEIYENWFFNPREPLDSPTGSWTNEAIIQPTETAWRNVEFADNYYGTDANVEYSDIIPDYDGR